MGRKDMLEQEIIKRLITAALDAREKSYAPYSSFMVGAAVYTENGQIYSGCNVENSSYGAANCAERTAIYKAVSEGHRNIKAVAVVAGMKFEKTVYTSPCGICRQVIAEFGDDDTYIIMAVSPDEYKIVTLNELLPYSFDFNSYK
ncbi:MAG: cytidine deaminase [Coprococcus sp.]|nr:cytidine deaminase [Coprococcus sp.]